MSPRIRVGLVKAFDYLSAAGKQSTDGSSRIISLRSETPSWMPHARLLASFLSAEPTGFLTPSEHAAAVCSLAWAAAIAEREDDYAFGSWPEFFSN